MKKLLHKVNELKREREEKQQEVKLSYGQQDPMDVISYSALVEHPDYLEIDGNFVRVVAFTGWPHEGNLGFLNGLVNFHHNVDISFHIEQVPSNTALRLLRRKITELRSQQRSRLENRKDIGPDIEDPLFSAISVREGIMRGQEKLFQVSLYVSIMAKSKEELEEITKLLEANLSANLFYIKTARYQQLEGLQSVLPRAEDLLKQRRNLNTPSASLTFPFTSDQFVQETGILYGANDSNSLSFVDRFALNNANSIVFAQSGSGKSYATKVEILRHLSQGTKVIVIDPEREYENLAKSVEGTYIKLSAKSDQKINPFDLATTSHTKDRLAEHAQDLLEVISLMVGGLSEHEKAGVDKAIMAVYKAAKGKTPILADFYDKLHSMGQHKLCERLEKYTKGSLTNILDSQTNIELTNRLVVFDIKDLPESLRQIMMMIISNFVQSVVKTKPEKRLLVIDEGWLLLEHDESARFIAGLVRRARKYFLGVTFITQLANDFLGNKYGRAIASQSSLRMLMKQDETTIDQVVAAFNLSERERRYLLTCDRGEALIMADRNHFAIKIMASEDEHPLITTDPNEVYQS